MPHAVSGPPVKATTPGLFSQVLKERGEGKGLKDVLGSCL